MGLKISPYSIPFCNFTGYGSLKNLFFFYPESFCMKKLLF